MLDLLPGRQRSVRLSVVVPFHRNLDQLRRCLAALKASALALPAGAELTDFIVAADGAVDAPGAVADEAGARERRRRFGPALAPSARPRLPRLGGSTRASRTHPSKTLTLGTASVWPAIASCSILRFAAPT